MTGPTGRAMIRVDRLTMRYGDRTVLAGVSFDVAEHEIVSVVGPSGCGKTTLLRCVAGLCRTSERHGHDRRAAGHRTARRGSAWSSSTSACSRGRP